MIEEDYVSFETAKLLKEKGFDIPCNTYFVEVEKETAKNKFKRKFCHSSVAANRNAYKSEMANHYYFSCPTLQMVTKWLRKNFNMNPVPYATSIGWYFEVFDLTQRDITGCALLYQVGIPSKEKTFETSEEACEAGIMYCLENLI